MSSKGDKKELEILCRYVPRVVLSQYAHSRVALKEPATTTFPAVMALFDISGFSSLADRLAKEENVKPLVGVDIAPKRPSTSSGHIAKQPQPTMDLSRLASHRRISHASTGRQDSVRGDDAPINTSKRSSNAPSFSNKEKRASVGGNAGGGSSDMGLMRTGMAVEQLTKTLNQTLAPVIDIITQFNGDIIKFAGDAMIVMWETASSKLGDEPPAVDPGVVLFTAISCALQVLRMLESQDHVGATTLKMHVGMGYSSVTGNHVGGLLNRWEFYVGGAATGQMSIAEGDAHEGELVVSAECYDALVGSAAVQPLGIDAVKLARGNFKITGLKSAANVGVKYSLPTLRLGRDLIPLIKSYVPGCIALSLGKGKIVINGMRSITAIFIKFAGILDIPEPERQLQEVHRCLCAVQDAAYRVHATIRQFLIDDKGAVAIVVVGLPPFYHENNALHGIRMALYLQEKGVSASIGITSGPAFCGSIGSSVRAEYAVVGDVINLSARLMSMAAPGQILCDESTHTATLTRFEFDQGTHVMVKGKGDFIVVYRVFQDAMGASPAEKPAPGDIFIPSGINDFVIKRVDDFGKRSRLAKDTARVCQTILVRGASGVGKTTLLRHLTHVHPKVFYSCGDSVEKNTKLFVWRKVVTGIVFGMHGSPPTTTSHGVPDAAHRHGLVVMSQSHRNVVGTSLERQPSATKFQSTHSSSASPLLSRIGSKTGSLISRLGSASQRSLAPATTVLAASDATIDETTSKKSFESTDQFPDTLLRRQPSASSILDDDSTSEVSTVDLRANFGAGLQFIHSIVESGELGPESLPLLNVFIPHCFPETSHSLELAQHEDRFMHDVMLLVLTIVKEANRTHPILLAWDDCQWIDAASWDLLLKVLELSPTITCVVGVRTDALPPHAEFKRLEAHTHALKWEMRNLSLRDTSLLLSHRYGIAIMNSYLLEYVHGRAGGNPGHTIALMQRLLDLDTIYIDLERGVVHVLKDIHDVDLEISLQTRAKVMHHFDQLNTAGQLALRIVSVSIDYIHFDALSYLLRAVFAIEYNASFTHSSKGDDDASSTSAAAPSFSDHGASLFVQALLGLGVCENHGLVAVDHHNEVVRFASDDMRLVVYNVMLPSQRETIHRVFAMWFETEVPLHRIPRFQHCYHLAYHLSRTRMYNQSMHYFAKGAEEALLRGVSDFALMCLTSAGAVLLLMDTAPAQSGRDARPRGIRKSSSRTPLGLDDDDGSIEISLHQCKIEFLTGLVMVQKSDWPTAVDNLNVAIAIYHELVRKHKLGPWDRQKRKLRKWWADTCTLRRPIKVKPLSHRRSITVGIHVNGSIETLLDEVESLVGVATRLKTKILKVEREHEKTSNEIRLQGLRCISSIKDDVVVNLEKTFLLVPESKQSPTRRSKKQPLAGSGSSNLVLNARPGHESGAPEDKPPADGRKVSMLRNHSSTTTKLVTVPNEAAAAARSLPHS
ncbi:Aste57867_18693 [Aphanomyces stellatus]|uniref:Aste57867_18693 protein n=1 Tax=Aphanomyces stellatus TaxID=120398 RepID=A0A485LB07_9STRA|nr:hypothetical protein As57867_018631 [Aphanomyces stellatus]VFT95428.1 Aste57867_18693 [Aphanomyces stellatus]